MPEDGQRVHKALQSFIEVKRSPKTLEQYGVSPDINSHTLQTLETLDDQVRGVVQRPESLNQIPEGAEKVYDDGVYAAVKVETQEAACSIASGTKWCTADPGAAEHYLSSGPLFVWYKNGKKFAQSDTGGQFMDLRDDPITVKDPQMLMTHVEVTGSLPESRDVDPQVEYFAHELVLEDMVKEDELDQLMTYWLENSGSRSEAVEKYLLALDFDDPYFTIDYLLQYMEGGSIEDFHEGRAKIIELLPQAPNAFQFALLHASNYITEPWEEFEEFLLKNGNPEDMLKYLQGGVRDVAWVESNPQVKSLLQEDPQVWSDYENLFL